MYEYTTKTVFIINIKIIHNHFMLLTVTKIEPGVNFTTANELLNKT